MWYHNAESHSVNFFCVEIEVIKWVVTLQKEGCNLSLTDARVAVVVVSGNTHNTKRINHPQCHGLRLQHVCGSYNANSVIHPIGLYTHNAHATGIRIIHPIAIYTHNANSIIHPIAIYTHNAIGFVFNLCCFACSASCFFSCVF